MMTLAFISAMLCQDEIRNELVTKLDPHGDAAIEITFALSASQWLKWKANVGDHPDLMKRDLVRRFSTAVVENVKLDMQAMDRKATASLTAKGEARYKGSGKFELVLPATWSKVTDTGSEWHFTHSELAGRGVMLKQVNKIVLPPGAANAKLSGPSGGEQILSYEIPKKGGFNPMYIFSGVGLVLFVLVTVLRFTLGAASPGAQPAKG
jgi:hypothetical protein